MHLKMTAGLSGPLFNLSPGDEYDFDADEAKRLKDAGFAVDAEPGVQAPAKTKKGKAANVVSSDSGGRAD
ncbi:hypothetical protein [Sinorhizobium fredii]|uniref:hypothetical protein n=1 Tax=Rhizobium fredii TaxID=380 RepID=UPI003517A388